jgi:hypothetical protein
MRPTINHGPMSIAIGVLGLLLGYGVLHGADPQGFVSLFNGRDFSGWKVPTGDNGHWRIVDGVIDYDGESESAADKHLWTEKEFGDFVLRVDWRIKEAAYQNPRVSIIKPDGTHKLNERGEEIKIVVPDSDSGVYLRGQGKSQVNIWCWPIGSGEVYGYRMDKSMLALQHHGAKRDGQWTSPPALVQFRNISIKEL